MARAERTPNALTDAVRAAGRFDRSAVSATAGLLPAIPVVAVLGGSIAAGDPVAGVTMGAGAMLVGIAGRVGGGRPPLALMATDALLMAISTFVGSVTGSILWLHLVVLGAWALFAGLLVGVSSRGGVLSAQSVVAAVVFGRFSEPAPAALGLAALVFAGGGAQVVFLLLLRWPLPLRTQRAAVAAAYRELGRLAAAPGGASTLPAGTALDDASESLAAPALLGDSALMTLRSLVNEGQRMRVQLAAIQSLLAQSADRGSDERTRRILAISSHVLELSARAIKGDGHAAAQLAEARAALAEQIGATETIPVDALPGQSAPLHMSRRLSSLAGQLRAVSALAPAAGEGGGLRSRRPHPRTSRPLLRVRAALDQLRADATLRSPAGRHALRLATVVVITELIARHVALPRSYWMVVAAATTLRPEFGATFTRGTERLAGTMFGVALAGAITVGLHPAGGMTVLLVGVLAWAAYSVFPASFAAGFGFITALVVFLINVISPDTLATASARLLDTVIGGALGLIAYAVWPTWSEGSARQALADLAAAQRAYLDAVLGAVVAGQRLRERELTSLSRRARLARTEAESRVAVSIAEPATRRIDADESRGALGEMRRLVQAVHVLRLDAEDERERSPLPALAPLLAAVDAQLTIIEDVLRTSAEDRRTGPLPDLRSTYQAFEQVCPHDEEGEALLAELDEIVDAVNALAAVLGLEQVGDDRPLATAGG